MRAYTNTAPRPTAAPTASPARPAAASAVAHRPLARRARGLNNSTELGGNVNSPTSRQAANN